MPKTIIVIDDSPTVRQEVSTVLSGAGYSVVEAEDGLLGERIIRENPTALLAICDINMPRLSGLELLELLRGPSSSTAVPFLMLTTEGRPDLIERARASGAKGWIVKPFKPSMLLAAVRKLAREEAA